MTQPVITLTAGSTVLDLDPDLHWSDEFSWNAIEQSATRSITGALLIDQGERIGGRPITLAPPDDSSAWMSRAVLEQLRAWEATLELPMVLRMRGIDYPVQWRRFDGAAIEANPVVFVADPVPGQFGDFYLTTLRFFEV